MPTQTADRFIDLLIWIKERNLNPTKAKASDLYLCPHLRQLSTYRNLRPHQRRTALWLPTERGLRALGIPIQRRTIGPLTVLKAHRLEGAGQGEHEACLSLMNRLRRAN